MEPALKLVKDNPRVSAKMELQELIGKPIATYPQLAKPLGSKQAADLFSQLLYWWDGCDQETGFYITLEALAEQTGLTIKQVRVARSKLIDLGVVVATEKRLQHRTYYTLNTDVLFQHLATCQKGSPEVPKGQSGDTKRAAVEMPKGQSYIEQKTTTKLNTKNKTKDIAHIADASAPCPVENPPPAKQKKQSAHAEAIQLLADHGVGEQVAKDFLTVRADKRAKSLTVTAMSIIAKQAEAANLTVEQAITVCIQRNWVGFQASWLMKDGGAVKATKPSVKDIPVHTQGGVLKGW